MRSSRPSSLQVCNSSVICFFKSCCMSHLLTRGKTTRSRWVVCLYYNMRRECRIVLNYGREKKKMYIIPQLKGEEKVEYVRKSRTDDPLLTVEEVLEKHEQMLKEWNEKNQPDGGPIPESNIYREVGSGETIANRPQMQAILRRIESPDVKALVCVEPSRLTRGDLEDIGYLVKILRYTKTIVITLRGAFDLNDDRDRDQFERELMRGNEYLEYTKQIQWNGRLLAVQNGNFIGQTAPYGYQKKQTKEGRRTCHTLEPHPDEAPVVQRIFEMYRSGLGASKIIDQLNAELIPAPKGPHWVQEYIPHILSNEHYLGKVVWNRRRTVRTVQDGEVIISRPRAEKYLIFEGKHDAIIDQELWDAVQEIRGKHPKNTKAKNLTNPLAGLLWCECGKAMTGRTYTKKGVERSRPRYLCNAQRYCGNASALMSEVLDEVARVLRESIVDFEIRIESGEEGRIDEHERLIARLEKRISELKALEIAQWSEKTKGEMPDHVFRELNRQTLADIETVQVALDRARESMPEPVNLQERVTTFQAALAVLQDPDAPIKEKNQLLKACIEKITYRRQRVGDFGHPKRGDETPIYMDFKLRV